jgi:hypothetical protein
MAFHIRDRSFAYVEPLWYLTIASYGLLDLVYPRTSAVELIFLGSLFALLRIATHSPSDLFSVPKLKHAVFAQFWLRVGKSICSSAFPQVISLTIRDLCVRTHVCRR